MQSGLFRSSIVNVKALNLHDMLIQNGQTWLIISI